MSFCGYFFSVFKTLNSKPSNQLPWLILGILESKFFVFSPIIYKFNFSWNELVELGSSAESSPMMGTPPPSGRLMRHSDPINDVLVSQITGRIAFILQPLSRSVTEVSNLPPIFFILTLLFLAHQGSQRDEGDSSKRMSSLHPNDEDKTYPKCSVSCT